MITDDNNELTGGGETEYRTAEETADAVNTSAQAAAEPETESVSSASSADEAAAEAFEIAGDSAAEETEETVIPESAAVPEPPRVVWTFAEQVQAERKKDEASGGKGALTYAIVMTSLFVVCFAVLAVLIVSGYNHEAATAANKVYIDRTVYVRDPSLADSEYSVSEIQSKLQPSTVGVSVVTPVSTGVGTGIVITEDGYIATNYHVIENATSIKVRMYDNTEYTAELIDGDVLSDVAVIKAAVGSAKLIPAEFGNSDALVVGEYVVAIGNPAGLEYAGTVTTGIISAINRNVKIYSTNGLLEKSMTLIQTTANLNPGNSGGPLIDMNGKVIGINTMKLGDNFEGIGFAIPSNGAKSIIDEIISTGKYSGGSTVAEKGVSLGITCTDVTEGKGVMIDAYTTVEPAKTGVMVIEEAKEGSSAYGYLRAFDIITSIDGTTVTETEQMRTILFAHHVGDTVKLRVWRDGAEITVEIPLK